MIRQFLADEAGSPSIEYGLIAQHHCSQQTFVSLPTHEPAREAEVAPCSAAQYWLRRHSSISPASSVSGAKPVPLGKRFSSQYPIQFLAQLMTAITKQNTRHS
jgi:hypothetical protein